MNATQIQTDRVFEQEARALLQTVHAELRAHNKLCPATNQKLLSFLNATPLDALRILRAQQP